MVRKYQVTRKECQERIDRRGDVVCPRCGRKIVPMKTADNSGQPTYWAGCWHGQIGEDRWGHFSHGVPRGVYEMAVKMVINGDYGRTTMQEHTGDLTDDFMEYWFEKQVVRAVDKVQAVFRAMNFGTVLTKKQFMNKERDIELSCRESQRKLKEKRDE